MSRIAKEPIPVPAGVEIKLDGQGLWVKGQLGEQSMTVHDSVEVALGENQLTLKQRDVEASSAMSGTMRALASNLVQGVNVGFSKKLILVGVGYRAQVAGKDLNLTLGFSHPVAHPIPDDITRETPTPTEIVVKGINKQRVGQTAAEIRGYRPPEPYKGKGVKYSDERIVRKEAKKK
ncbi:MAG: 50S ribosomal protein L6 [Gammaproteobacteria bacterium]|nr:50S ribosomal protein L6 [Gammaproteobacteria bacterium]